MEEALYEISPSRPFAELSLEPGAVPDETTFLNFGCLLEAHGLAMQIFETVNCYLTCRGLRLSKGKIVDTTTIAAPSSTKNASGRRDPEMNQTKKGHQWHFGIKAHIGVDAETGLVHSLAGTAAHVHGRTQAESMLHGSETDIFADAVHRGIEKRERGNRPWHVAMRQGERRALNDLKSDQIRERIEQVKASVRVTVEYPFRVVTHRCGLTKVLYRGLAKNTAQLHPLFALANLGMIRRHLLPTG
jgi:IS5 family transposase